MPEQHPQLRKGCEMGILTKSVHYHKSKFLATGLWKSLNKFHSGIHPNLNRDLSKLEQARGSAIIILTTVATTQCLMWDCTALVIPLQQKRDFSLCRVASLPDWPLKGESCTHFSIGPLKKNSDPPLIVPFTWEGHLVNSDEEPYDPAITAQECVGCESPSSS